MWHNEVSGLKMPCACPSVYQCCLGVEHCLGCKMRQRSEGNGVMIGPIGAPVRGEPNKLMGEKGRRKFSKRNTSRRFHLLSMSSGRSSKTFRKTILPPSSGSKSKPSKKQWKQLQADAVFLLVSCLSHCSTMKLEAVRSCETWMDLQLSTRRHIPIHSAFRGRHCESLEPKYTEATSGLWLKFALLLPDLFIKLRYVSLYGN
jgi:hypothetical protein